MAHGNVVSVSILSAALCSAWTATPLSGPSTAVSHRRSRAADGWFEALRHAAAAGDTAVLARIAESTRGVRVWLEQGLEGLRAVDGLLTAEVLSRYLRLALVRCVARTVSGDIDGAKRLYGPAAEETAGFTRDREGGDDRALQTDHIFVQACSTGAAAAPMGPGSWRR